MLFPGSVYLLQKALMPVLLQGQARLVEEVRLPCPCPLIALSPQMIWSPVLNNLALHIPYSV